MSVAVKEEAHGEDGVVLPHATSESGSGHEKKKMRPGPERYNSGNQFDDPKNGSLFPEDGYFPSGLSTAPEGDSASAPQELDKLIPISLHPDADMYVNVTHRDNGSDDVVAVFLVNSVNIATASTSWHCMIYTGEHNDGLRAITMSGSAEGLHPLFNICHFNFHKIDSQMPVETLLEISLDSVEYGCTHLLRPWASTWLDRLKHIILDEKQPVAEDTILCIAFSLGSADLYEEAMRRLILHSKVQDGKLIHQSGIKLSDMNLCDQAIGHVAHERYNTVQRLFSLLDDAWKGLTHKCNDYKFCKAEENKRECETVQIGTILREMVDMDLYPLTSAREYTGDVTRLSDFLQDFRPSGFCEKHLPPHERKHDSCGVTFADDTKRVMKEIKAISPEHVECLEFNASLVGTEQLSDFDSYSRDRT